MHCKYVIAVQTTKRHLLRSILVPFTQPEMYVIHLQGGKRHCQDDYCCSGGFLQAC